jgi:hypothetical protein
VTPAAASPAAIAAAGIAAIAALTILARLHVPMIEAAVFLLWVGLLVWPAGRLVIAAWRLASSVNAIELVALQLGAGLVVVALGSMAGSIAAGRPGVRTVLFALAAGGIAHLVRSRRSGAGADPAWRIVALIAAAGVLAHMALLPDYFSGIDKTDRLVIAGVGGDGFYLPVAQQIARVGRLLENPFYAGQSMLYHHFLSNYLVAGYWLTTPAAVDSFSTRLLMHFVLGTPLLVLLLTMLVWRWTHAVGWTAALVALFVLPVTSYPNHGIGWEGVEGMNAFWVIGVHGDLGYLLGLVVLLLLVFVVDLASVSQRADWRWLAAAQMLLAAATQFKFNFLLGYGLPAEVAILALAYRQGTRVFVSTAITGIASLLVVQAGALAVSTLASGRWIELSYGLLAQDKLLGALVGNAGDGLAPLVALVTAVSGPLQPVAIVAGYTLAYTPLFAMVAVHAAAALHRGAPIDWLLVGTALCSLFVVLWVVEGGAGTPHSWNMAGHLHYLVPFIAVAATARLLGAAGWGRRLAIAATMLTALSGATHMIRDGGRFEFWKTWSFPDTALVAMLQDVDRQAPPDAVLLTVDMPRDLADEYVAMITNRSLFVSNSFAYVALQPDAERRRALVAAVREQWPVSPALPRDGFNGLPSARPLFVLGKIPPDSVTPPGARCHERYCFWPL